MTDCDNFECADGKEYTFVVKKAKLLKFELLDGAEDKFLAADADQFVNLDRAQKWVDNNKVKTLGRLGYKPKLYVEFDLPGISTFKIKIIPNGANITYSDEEKGRNPRFKFLEEKEYQTESDGKLVISDAFLDVCGGNDYYFSCTDSEGTSLQTPILTVKRKLFIQEIKMKGTAGASAASNINTTVAEYEKQGFDIDTLGSEEMVSMENIDVSDSDTYKSNVSKAYKKSPGKKKEPFTLTIGYTSHLAVKTEGREITKKNVEVGPGKPPVVINIAGPGKTNPAVSPKYLWQDIVTGESWYEDCYFQQQGGLKGFFNWKDSIPKESCTAVAVNSANPSMSSKVSIDVTSLAKGKKGKIVLKLSWVDRMRAGLSFGGNNLICICTKAWWRSSNSTKQNQVIIHEMGHKIGLVPDGTGSSTDKIDTFYDSSKGHVGTHCHHGVAAGQTRYDDAASSSSSDCVMYGSTNGHSAFCEHCAPAAKKEDISAGWPGL